MNSPNLLARLRSFVGCILLAGSAAVLPAYAQDSDVPTDAAMEQVLPSERELSLAESKVHTQLLVAISPSGEASAQDTDTMIEVDIVAEVSDSLLDEIDDLGGTVVNAFAADHAIRAKMPLGEILELAEEDAVVSIDPGSRLSTNADVAATEGDVAHEANIARQQYGVDGSGIKVCVLSDSNDDGQGALQHAKDIGAIDEATTSVLHDANEGAQDGMNSSSHTGEGLAMMEIIHQLAPGASIEFATGHPNPSQMAQNIRALADGGCRIIVDDIDFPNELPFQEDVIAQAVRYAVSRGISYFVSATNYGNVLSGTASVWEGEFVDSGNFFNDPAYPGHFNRFDSADYLSGDRRVRQTHRPGFTVLERPGRATVGRHFPERSQRIRSGDSRRAGCAVRLFRGAGALATPDRRSRSLSEPSEAPGRRPDLCAEAPFGKLADAACRHERRCDLAIDAGTNTWA